MKPGDTIRLDSNTVAQVTQVLSFKDTSYSGVASVGTLSAIFWGTFRFSEKSKMWIRN